MACQLMPEDSPGTLDLRGQAQALCPESAVHFLENTVITQAGAGRAFLDKEICSKELFRLRSRQQPYMCRTLNTIASRYMWSEEAREP